MDKILRNCVTDLLLSDRETGGRPALSEAGREEVVAKLPQLLTNDQRLQSYLDGLVASAAPFGGIRHSEPLTDEQTEKLLTSGAGALEREVLAQLMLNPLALRAASTD